MDSLLKIQLDSLDNSNRDLDPVLHEVVTWIFKNIKKYGTSVSCKNVISCYLEESFSQATFDQEQSIIWLPFPEPGGQCGISAAVSYHWSSLCLIQLRESLNDIIKKYGYAISVPEKNLETLMNEESSELFLENGDKIQKIVSYEDSVQIINDDDFFDIAEASPDLQKQVKGIMQTRKCECSLCKKIRKGNKPVTVKSTADKLPKEPHFYKVSTALRFPHYAKSLLITEEKVIPPEISKLQNLEEIFIDISGEHAPFPEELGMLKSLKSFTAFMPLIEGKTLNDSIGDMKKLEVLNLRIKNLNRIPESVCNLSSLKTLLVYATHLNYFPDDIGKLQNLETLHLFAHLKEIPKTFDQLKKLTDLTLHYCRHIPVKLQKFDYSTFPALESLSLLNRGFSEIPRSVFDCTGLKKLDLREIPITTVPTDIINLTKLEKLYIERVNFPELTPEVCSLKHLKDMSFWMCDNLKELNPEIGNLENLEELRVSWCKSIKHLPDSLGECKKLKHLYIDGSGIGRLPETLKNCENLEAVHCHSEQREAIINQLESLGMDHVSV